MARLLSPEEAELCARVTSTIRPLSREVLAPSSPKTDPVVSAPPRGRLPPARPAVKSAPVRPPSHAAATLDGSWDKKLRSGSVTPDRVVDLHGLNLDRAWQAIDLALEQAITAGDRVLLLITGHHRPGEPPVERGRIRAAVHDWLAASRHAPSIAAVRGAHRRHGGGGSLYLILRRR